MKTYLGRDDYEGEPMSTDADPTDSTDFGSQIRASRDARLEDYVENTNRLIDLASELLQLIPKYLDAYESVQSVAVSKADMKPFPGPSMSLKKVQDRFSGGGGQPQTGDESK